MDSGTWRMSRNGQEFGPYTVEQLRQYAGSGQIGAQDLLWRPGMSAWVPAWQVPELSGYVRGGQVPGAAGVSAARPGRGRKVFVGILVAILVVLAGILLVTTLLPSGIGIRGVDLASSVDADGVPVTMTDEFDPDTPEIHASVDVRNPGEGAGITASWFWEDEDVLIDSVRYVPSEQEERVLFSLTRPDAGWPAGSYRVDFLSDDDKVLKSATFTVPDDGISATTTTAAPVSGAGVTVTQAVTCMSVTEDFEAIGVTDEFAVDTPEIYVLLDLDWEIESARIVTHWYWLDGDTYFAEVELDAVSADDQAYFYVTVPDEGWPTGTYMVEEEADGTDIYEVVFEIA